MVLRKPYGFLIKHFRLIHLIITGILIYLVSYNREIYKFLNSCIDDAVNKYNALSYINYNIYIYIIISIILFFIIYWLLKYKDKPRNIYILSIICYIFIGIYIFILFSYFSGLPSNVLNQKVIRAYRDIMLISLGLQYLLIIIMLIRGLGFDIKKFNFGKDIQELNLSSEDAEEIEVDVNIDTTNMMRSVRKRKRELGYFFNEYKVFILGILSIIIIFIGFNSYKYLKKIFQVYNQGDIVGNTIPMTVRNSYYNISDNKNYIIIKFDISKYGKQERLNVANMILSVNNKEYVANKNICNNFNNVGNCYKKQYITDKSNTYILVYEVDSLNSEKSYLLYKESYDNTFKIKLDLENYE